MLGMQITNFSLFSLMPEYYILQASKTLTAVLLPVYRHKVITRALCKCLPLPFYSGVSINYCISGGNAYMCKTVLREVTNEHLPRKRLESVIINVVPFDHDYSL